MTQKRLLHYHKIEMERFEIHVVSTFPYMILSIGIYIVTDYTLAGTWQKEKVKDTRIGLEKFNRWLWNTFSCRGFPQEQSKFLKRWHNWYQKVDILKKWLDNFCPNLISTIYIMEFLYLEPLISRKVEFSEY